MRENLRAKLLESYRNGQGAGRRPSCASAAATATAMGADLYLRSEFDEHVGRWERRFKGTDDERFALQTKGEYDTG